MFFLWPPKPQFEHFAAFLSFWGRSPHCGHVVILCPGSQHILEKRVRLLVPHPFPACAFAVSMYFLLFAPRSSYEVYPCEWLVDRAFVFCSGAFSPTKLPSACATCTNGESCVASVSLLLLPSPCIDLQMQFNIHFIELVYWKRENITKSVLARMVNQYTSRLTGIMWVAECELWT